MENLSINEKAKRYDRLFEIFDGTLLDGIIDMTSEDLLDSPLPVEEGDIVIDYLNALEMRIHTTMSWTNGDIAEMAEENGISPDSIERLCDLCQEGDSEGIKAFSLSEIPSAEDLEMDTEDWTQLFDLIYELIGLKEVLRRLIEFRIDNMENVPFIIKEGFSIVRIDQKTYKNNFMFFN